jgi:ubiquinone/menaquinone biosynthesis C-methylase UbiE
MECRTLSHQQAKAFYDRFGKKQDSQSFYEDMAINALIRKCEFDKAGAVLEFGCGTGRFAERLIERHLPPNARYVGVDISDTMVALAKERLVRFGLRAEVHLVSGSPQLDFETGAFDRFVSNYVLDLLEFEDMRRILAEAWRILSDGGLLGLVSLTHGFTFASRAVESIWKLIYAVRPALVGGCRPISLFELVAGPSWKILYDNKFSAFGVPSEVLVTKKMAKMDGDPGSGDGKTEDGSDTFNHQ